jgi:hypothetical protein
MLLETLFGTSVYGIAKIFQYTIAKQRLESGETLKSGTRLEPLTGYEKCIQLFAKEQTYDAPMYINTNWSAPGIGIPIGGSISSEFKEIYSTLYGGQEKPTQTNWDFKLQGIDSNVSYINTSEDYNNFLTSNSFIDKHSFPVSLPLQVQTYKLDPTATLWKVRRGYLISNSRPIAVCNGALYHTFRGWRKPVSVAVGFVWITTSIVCFMTWHTRDGAKQQLERIQKRFGYI